MIIVVRSYKIILSNCETIGADLHFLMIINTLLERMDGLDISRFRFALIDLTLKQTFLITCRRLHL